MVKEIKVKVVGEYEGYKTISQLIEEIGDDWVGVDTLTSLSRLIPVGSVLWFEGERVKSSRVNVVIGRGLREVVTPFKLVYPEGGKLDPAMYKAYGLPNATLEALENPAEAFFAQFYIKPDSLYNTGYGGIETSIVNPLTTRVVSRP